MRPFLNSGGVRNVSGSGRKYHLKASAYTGYTSTSTTFFVGLSRLRCIYQGLVVFPPPNPLGSPSGHVSVRAGRMRKALKQLTAHCRHLPEGARPPSGLLCLRKLTEPTHWIYVSANSFMAPRAYRMTRRAAANAETRRRIADAAITLHAEKGIHATTWPDIAKRADVALGTVYCHFPSLDQLVPACTSVNAVLMNPPGVG